MDKELAKEQTRVNKEFRILNDEARRKNWSTLTTDEERASADPERFLRDRFFRQTAKKPSAKGDAIILKTNDRIKIHQAAGPLDLFTESTEAPLEPNGAIPRIDRWIVVGTSKAAVSDKIREINRPSKQKAPATSKGPKISTTKIEPKTPKTSKTGANPSPSVAKKESKAMTTKRESQTTSGLPSKRKFDSIPSSGLTNIHRETDGPPRKKQVARKSAPSQMFVGPFLSSESPRKSVGSHIWPDDSRGHTLNASSASTKIVPSASHDRVKKESADSKSQAHWDVTGKWRLYCQALEEGWSPEGGSGKKPKFSMIIYCQNDGPKYQLWALFNLYPLTGVFRFMEPQSLLATAPAPSRKSKSHIKSEPDSDQEEFEGGEIFDNMEDVSDDSRDEFPVPPSSFSLSSLPSSSTPVVPFRNRNETEYEEIQLGDDQYPCSMTFSAEGTKCNGIWTNGITGTMPFSGFKLDSAVPKPKRGPQKEWKARGEKVYNRRAVERWGTWYGSEKSSNDDEEGEENDSNDDEDGEENDSQEGEMIDDTGVVSLWQ